MPIFMMTLFCSLFLINSKVKFSEGNYKVDLKLEKYHPGKVDDTEIKTQLKEFEKKLNDNKFVKKLKEKGVNLQDLQMILDNYSRLKIKNKKDIIKKAKKMVVNNFKNNKDVIGNIAF